MRSHAAGFAVALGVFVLDQLVKWAMIGPLALRQVGQVYVLPFFNLHWTENRGTAYGLFSASSDTGRWVLVAFTAAIAVGVGVWLTREKNRADQVALGMILGGAIGNIVDRVRLGYVVDYADLHLGAFRPFLVFNVADAAISIGVVLLLLRSFLVRNERPEESAENA